MTYTMLAAVAVPLAVLIDLLVLRTRLVLSSTWWLSYAVVVGFQLLTNGWLTGRGIVRYDPGTIIGGAEPRLLGDGRIAYAPVEDLGFGFALVLLSCAVWTRLGRARRATDATR
ncbi:lycopene cyclase domain-containing protein [Luteipulveratus halotolerans]|uniref:Lycopene cyclase n=1 Tax=Luteipulveratus halotolerans TaxID=1631356 RepID=A0A0L6CGN9_9MICO|nr:lycopene cyclase domain-containing protein [Luteipulveratus halotolerans]KNX36962.1 lycopene cyclase [Luteipulveratus halotolerans]